MLLVALLMGGGSALAAVTTYDFKSFVAGGIDMSKWKTLTLTTEEVEQKGTNAKNVYIMGKQTNTSGTVLDCSKIAICSNINTNNQMRWIWRSSSNAYQNGLAAQWNSKGTAVTSFNISILSLNKGDKVTITYSIQSGKNVPGKDAQLYVCSSDILSTDGTTDKALAAETVVASGTTYTVLANGNLDMYDTNNNMAIQSIKIESDKVEESIETPVISVVGANAGNRIVSINAKETNSGNATTTYYTLDGSDPTTSSKVYKENITVSENDATEGKVIVKALTVKTADNTVKSEIASLEISEIGKTIELNAPVISISFKQNGNSYVPVYSFTSDQSSLIGKPAVSYEYEINGKKEKGTSYEASQIGTLKVTATADGYTAATSEVNIANVLFNQSYTYDFTTLTEHSETTVGNQTVFNGAGCQAYSLETSIPNLVFKGMSQLWAITAKKTLGLYARTGKGTITYEGEFPAGSMLYAEANGSAVVSTTNEISYNQYGFAKNVSVYVPIVSLSLSTDYTYSTYTPSSDVNLANEAGVEFYAAKANGNKVVLTNVQGTVKAGTGLLVKNTNKVASVTLATATDGKTVENNDLVGVTADMTAADFEGKNAYILVSDTQFQKVGSGTEGTLAKGKAYLLAGTTAAARLLTIGNPTAINGVAEKAAEGADTIYNMQGMRVDNAATSGLYIINGKKYIKK